MNIQIEQVSKIEKIRELIKEFGISMPKLASKVGMSSSSFKKKIEPSKYPYKFSDEELTKLENAVLELSKRLSEV